ncbi:hypothetical protein H8959_019018 [Pygathrix nigripes]
MPAPVEVYPISPPSLPPPPRGAYLAEMRIIKREAKPSRGVCASPGPEHRPVSGASSPPFAANVLSLGLRKRRLEAMPARLGGGVSLPLIKSSTKYLKYLNQKDCNEYIISFVEATDQLVIRLAWADSYINELVIFIFGVLVLVMPLIFICISYGFIIYTILKIPSAEGKQKAFSTCASHLIVVIVHYGCASFVYLRPSAKYTSDKARLVTVTYTIITPLLNPMVYSLKNKDGQLAIQKLIGKSGFSLKTL